MSKNKDERRTWSPVSRRSNGERPSSRSLRRGCEKSACARRRSLRSRPSVRWMKLIFAVRPALSSPPPPPFGPASMGSKSAARLRLGEKAPSVGGPTNEIERALQCAADYRRQAGDCSLAIGRWLWRFEEHRRLSWARRRARRWRREQRALRLRLRGAEIEPFGVAWRRSRRHVRGVTRRLDETLGARA